MNVLGTINITERQMAFEKKPNCKFKIGRAHV